MQDDDVKIVDFEDMDLKDATVIAGFPSIGLVSTIAAVNDNGKKPYTEEEKYKYLLEKNPYLKDLKQQLGLDFE